MKQHPYPSLYRLIFTTAVGGLANGLLLPLLALLADQSGSSTVANGFSSSGMYIGILLVTPLLEFPVRRFGYKATILAGLALISLMTLLFPVTSGPAVWFALRFLAGVGDSALHYSCQLWIGALAPQEKRGRWFTFYGFAYGTGFSIGPLGMVLLKFGTWAPFLALVLCNLIAFLAIWRMQSARPEATEAAQTTKKEKNRYLAVISLGWLALLPSFLYGYLESTLNVSMPVYYAHEGRSVDQIAALSLAFTIGGLILQLPLGTWSDRIGRKTVLILGSITGGLLLAGLPFAGDHVLLMMALLAVVGGFVGSFYSLGIAYASDLLPNSLLATANVIMSLNYSIASILAPNANGHIMNGANPEWMIWIVSGMLVAFAVSGSFYKKSKTTQILRPTLPPLDKGLTPRSPE